MLREYDVVRLRRQSSKLPLNEGTEGTILVVFESDPPAYEVEFISPDGVSLGTFTVQDSDVELLSRPQG